MEELYFAAAYRIEACLNTEDYFHIESKTDKEKVLNKVIKQVFDEMNFPKDKLDSLRERLIGSIKRSGTLNIQKMSRLCKKHLDVGSSERKPRSIKGLKPKHLTRLVKGGRKPGKLTDFENQASRIGEVLGAISIPSTIRAYQALSPQMNQSQKLFFANRIKSSENDQGLNTILDLCQKHGLGLRADETLDLFETITDFEGDQYFDEKINLYKDLSQDVRHKTRGKLQEAIKKFPPDQYLATRAKLCTEMKGRASEEHIINFIEKVGGLPGDHLLQKKTEICMNLFSENLGGIDSRLLDSLHNPFESDGYEERKLDLFGKLAPHLLDFSGRTSLINMLNNLTKDNHAGIRMDLVEKLCASAKGNQIFDLLILVDQFPDDESLEEKFSICKDLCSDSDADENINLLLGIGIFPNDKVIKERAVLHKHLSAEMSSDQNKQLMFVLKDFNIQKGDDLKKQTDLFTEHLLDHYATDKNISKLFSSFSENPVSWIDQENPQVSGALNYLADMGAYKDSQLHPVNITVKRDEVLKDPVGTLNKLISEWEPQAADGEKLVLKVNFAKDDDKLEGGIDAGGLSRQYLSMLFEGLYKKFDLGNLSLEEGHKQKEEALENLGKLFMGCYHSSKAQEFTSESFEDPFVNTLLMGSQFRDEVFSAITSLTATECDGSLDTVPFDKRLEITKLLCPPSEKDDPPVHLELLYKDRDNISHEDRDKLITFVQATVIDEEDQQAVDDLNKAFASFLDNKNESSWTGMMDQLLKKCFDGRTEAVQTLAKGMKSLCSARKEGDVNEFWDERIRKESPINLSGIIQGNLNRDLVAGAVSCLAQSPVLERKTEYLREWIRDPTTNEDKLKKFLMILSGSPALPRNQKIAIQKLTREHAGLEFHTCAFQVDLCDNFEEISLLEGAPQSLEGLSNEELKDWEKKAFIQLLEKEIEGPLNFTSA